MKESKIDLTDRLRREGRWDEASKFKDTALADFRAKGVKKAEATAAAWAAMEANYPPLPLSAGQPVAVADVSGADPGGWDDELLDMGEILGNQAPVDLCRDVGWVYDRLLARNVTPQDSPSAGAWALLLWARRYKSRFYEYVVPKLLARREQEAADRELEDQEKRSIAEIERVLESLIEEESDAATLAVGRGH